MLENVVDVATILGGIGAIGTIVTLSWGLIRWWRGRRSVRVEADPEPKPGPVTRPTGFTEPAVVVTVVNEGADPVTITDVRLMFCRDYGAGVPPKAPPLRSHPVLPATLESGSSGVWYVPANQLSSLVGWLHRPASTTVQESRKVMLRPRCLTGTGKVCWGSGFMYPVDPNSHRWR